MFYVYETQVYLNFVSFDSESPGSWLSFITLFTPVDIPVLIPTAETLSSDQRTKICPENISMLNICEEK